MRIVILTCLLFIAACVSSGPQKSDDAQRSAAKTNTSLGQAYMDRGQNEVAMEKLKRAVAHDRTYAPAHTLLGVLYENIGDIEQAGKEYREAIKYDPDDGDVNNNYGSYLCRTGKYEEADPYFSKALKDPFYSTPGLAYFNAGNCSLQRGDLDKAEAYLRQSLKYDEKYAPALLSMADVSYRKGSNLRARAFLQRYESVGSLNEESLMLGYRIESALGDSKSANRYRQEFLERYPNSRQAGQLARQEQE